MVAVSMGGRTFFKVGAQAHFKRTIEIFVCELASVTSQALKYDVINFCQHV